MVTPDCPVRRRGGVDFNGTIFQDFHDIFGDFFGFEDMFGGGRGRGGSRRAQRGADLRYDMTLTFEEASTGVATKVKLPRQEYCEPCNGTGAKKGTGVAGVRHVRWPRAVGISAGIFHDHANVPRLPRRGADDQGALPRLPRARPHRERKND